jgi:hypothetical protein
MCASVSSFVSTLIAWVILGQFAARPGVLIVASSLALALTECQAGHIRLGDADV